MSAQGSGMDTAPVAAHLHRTPSGVLVPRCHARAKGTGQRCANPEKSSDVSVGNAQPWRYWQ